VAAAAGFVVLPTLGRVVNYPRLHTPEMKQLAAWARSSTPQDAVFLFPDAGRDADPGVFRAEALRAVYVDWKGGGQVNYLKELGDLWWDRWEETGKGKFRPADLNKLRRLNIDYIVLRAQNKLPGETPVFANDRFVVYHITHQYD
jgi:hypothetical protein